MRKTLSFYSLMGICLLSSTVFFSCKKEDALTIPPEVATFTNQTDGTYFITAPGVTYEIPVGLTTVSDQDRTINFTVSSPTGAVAGTDYSVSAASVVIPKGQTTGKITLTGVYAQYTAGQKDSLVFTITSGTGIAPSDYNSTFKLLMRGPCFDGEIVFSEMLGNYTKTFENGSYGPYTSTITGATQITPTTSTATITNVYDSGIPALATFDYTTPGSFTVTIPPQFTGFTAGGQQLFVRTTPGTTSTFSYCVPTFTIYIDLYRTSGLYDRWVMTMAR